MKKRLLSVLLAACMALSLLPATALAVDTPPGSGGSVSEQSETADSGNKTSEGTLPSREFKDVTSWAQVTEMIEAGATAYIALSDNITRATEDDPIVISEGKTVNLNLNGYVLDGGDLGRVIKVEEGGTLTIWDVPSDGRDAAGKITGGDTESGGGIYVDGGTLIMAGGAISGNEANSHDFTRKGDTAYEHWTALTPDPDWKQYE